MSTPPSLATDLDERAMDMDRRFRLAAANGEFSHDEGVELYRFWRSELAPQLSVVSVTVQVIGGMVRSDRGVESPQVQRTLREWMARKAATVVPFRRRGGGELPPAA